MFFRAKWTPFAAKNMRPLEKLGGGACIKSIRSCQGHEQSAPTRLLERLGPKLGPSSTTPRGFFRDVLERPRRGPPAPPWGLWADFHPPIASLRIYSPRR